MTALLYPILSDGSASSAAGGTRAALCYMGHAPVIEGLPTDYGPAEPFSTDQ